MGRGRKERVGGGQREEERVRRERVSQTETISALAGEKKEFAPLSEQCLLRRRLIVVSLHSSSSSS